MKILKRSSLVLLFLVYSGVVMVVSMSFGINTEHNAQLWKALTRPDPLPTVKTLEDQKRLYYSMKKPFALTNQGDK